MRRRPEACPGVSGDVLELPAHEAVSTEGLRQPALSAQNAAVARCQLATHNRLVEGSNPSGPTISDRIGWHVPKSLSADTKNGVWQGSSFLTSFSLRESFGVVSSRVIQGKCGIKHQ